MFKSSHRKKVVAAGIFAGLLVLSVFAVTGTAWGSAEKIIICHSTGSADNPFVEIEVSVNGWIGPSDNGHINHPGDFPGTCGIVPT